MKCIYGGYSADVYAEVSVKSATHQLSGQFSAGPKS